MFGWWREFLQIRYDFQVRKAELALSAKNNEVCQSCEVLKVELDRANRDKEQLLNRVLELTKPSPPEVKIINEPLETAPVQLGKKHIPFAVRREMMQAEDREQARLLKEHEKRLAEIRQQHQVPQAPLSTAKAKDSITELEKELGVNQEDGAKDAVSSR